MHETLQIRTLDYEKMRGKTYSSVIYSDRFLSIEPQGDGFDFKWVKSESEIEKPLQDEILSEWLENPVAYGAYINDELVGFVEGFLEKWNNRFRITNICVFDKENRHLGIGQKLIDRISLEAKESLARMIVLETQSFNYRAISFYKKNGFEIIGFDLFAYSNDGPEDRNIRIEMGKIINM